MNELEKVICNDVMADHQYVVDLRRYFHMNPETAKEEFGTAKRIEEELDKLGIEHKRVGETGVLCIQSRERDRGCGSEDRRACAGGECRLCAWTDERDRTGKYHVQVYQWRDRRACVDDDH